MYRSELESFIYDNKHIWENDSNNEKFFDNLKLIISKKKNSINEIWGQPCGLPGCNCGHNNLLHLYCREPKIIEKLLILGANPNTFFGDNTTFYEIIKEFVSQYLISYRYGHDTIQLTKIYETILYLLDYGADPNTFPKLLNVNNFDINFFLILYCLTIKENGIDKKCFTILVNFLKNFILKLNKKYLQDNNIRIIPADLVQHSIFTFDLEIFKHFQLNENDLGNLSTECIQSTKNLRIDKFRISIYFNISKIMNVYQFVKEKFEGNQVFIIEFEYDFNEDNFKDLKKLLH